MAIQLTGNVADKVDSTRTGENHELHGENNFNCTGKITRTARGFKLNGRQRRALFYLR